VGSSQRSFARRGVAVPGTGSPVGRAFDRLRLLVEIAAGNVTMGRAPRRPRQHLHRGRVHGGQPPEPPPSRDAHRLLAALGDVAKPSRPQRRRMCRSSDTRMSERHARCPLRAVSSSFEPGLRSEPHSEGQSLDLPWPSRRTIAEFRAVAPRADWLDQESASRQPAPFVTQAERRPSTNFFRRPRGPSASK
jgi:hypothetical protein